LVLNGDNISDSQTNNLCYIQAGTGVVTKVTMPNLKNFASIDGNAVIINKANLIVPIDLSSNIATFQPVFETALLELNSDNTYKYRSGQLAYIRSSTPNNQGSYPVAFSGVIGTTTKFYSFEITKYIQSILTGKYENDGFIINPTLFSDPTKYASYCSRSVINSTHASADRMRLEIYYTKVK
jgi:hypothetical protein